MSAIRVADIAGAVPYQRRSEPGLIADQVGNIGRWAAACSAREIGDRATALTAQSRQTRLHAMRRMDLLRRSQLALIDVTERHMRDSVHVLAAEPPVRAVLVHRNAWFLNVLTAQLTRRGVTVVSRLGNGADAVGVVIAEQPDLLLVEDALPMLTGIEVLRRVLPYTRHLVAAGQVELDETMTAVLEAGAVIVFARRVPPAEVAERLVQLTTPSVA